ncbi:hypothetical protein Hanom_Chr05g00412181 [Helianthus anomalus]
MDILFLKKIFYEDKRNNKVVRKALNNNSKVRIKLFERIALFDFDLCINYDYVHQKVVHIPPPNTSIPKELEKEAITGVILEQAGLFVVFRDIDGNKALFRTIDICKYSN